MDSVKPDDADQHELVTIVTVMCHSTFWLEHLYDHNCPYLDYQLTAHSNTTQVSD